MKNTMGDMSSSLSSQLGMPSKLGGTVPSMPTPAAKMMKGKKGPPAPKGKMMVPKGPGKKAAGM
ncbi:MAG TPA: hypothetical protein VG944_08425 [Fimbriimonas sp.]|nr:hypothetical protein [Fimbriimonas sp.]